MYCSFCGREIRNEAVFCSQCGKNQATGKMKNEIALSNNREKSILKSKKAIGVILALVVIIIVCFNFFGSKSIVGSWENLDGGSNLTFNSNGTFQYGAKYGTYEVYDDEISMNFQDFDMLGTHWTVTWNEDAEEDGKGWYISGNTLYFRGYEFKRVKNK